MRLFCSIRLCSSLVALMAACAAPAGSIDADDVDVAESEIGTTYGDLFDTLEGGDLDRWIDARRALIEGFDRICGDTICGGDYSNLSTVRLVCSSTAKARKMKDCVWVLGGNIDDVDGRTGKLTTDARSFTCRVPVASNAKAMLDTLEAAGDRALEAPLPGTGRSFYEALVDCFDGVASAPPPESTKSFYLELGDHLWNAGFDAGLAWSETRRRLNRGFDDACGDSFCEGEYPDITALGFACSLNANTNRVSRCSWTFAAADTTVDRRGTIVTTATTKRCNIEIGAQASALTAALAGDDPLRATLPGKTTSIYDALIGCL